MSVVVKPGTRVAFAPSKKQAMRRTVVQFQIKAADDGSRTFEGLAAVIGEMDLGRDIIEPGAFTKSLTAFNAKGSDAIPLLDSHNQYSIMGAYGQMVSAKETPSGLESTWEVMDGPEGDAILNRIRPSKLTKKAIVGKMSIGYIPVKWSIEQPDGTTSFWDQIRHLEEVELKEVSLVLFPMAPGASIDASTVKSFDLSLQAADVKSLERIDVLQLRQLATRIGTVLSKWEKDPDSKGKAKKPKPASAGDAMENGPVGTAANPVPPKPSDDEDDKADPEHPGLDDEDDDDIDVVPDPTKKSDPEHPQTAEEDDDTDHDVIANLVKDEEDSAQMAALCPECSGTMEEGMCQDCGYAMKSRRVKDAAIKKAVPYDYQEALEHRLKKTLLANRLSDAKRKQ